MEVLGAASVYPQVAKRFVNGFDDPRDYQNFFMTPEKSQAYLAQVAQAEA
jgi:hypothetical protein